MTATDDMTVTRPQADTLVIERVFAAPRALMWRMIADPVHLAKWWGPEGLHCPSVQMDVRPGGLWRTVMVNEAGERYEVGGVYREVAPDHHLSFTWAWRRDGEDGPESLVTFELEDAGDGCRLILRQTGLTLDLIDSHEDGWTSSLRCLIAAVV